MAGNCFHVLHFVAASAHCVAPRWIRPSSLRSGVSATAATVASWIRSTSCPCHVFVVKTDLVPNVTSRHPTSLMRSFFLCLIVAFSLSVLILCHVCHLVLSRWIVRAKGVPPWQLWSAFGYLRSVLRSAVFFCCTWFTCPLARPCVFLTGGEPAKLVKMCLKDGIEFRIDERLRDAYSTMSLQMGATTIFICGYQYSTDERGMKVVWIAMWIMDVGVLRSENLCTPRCDSQHSANWDGR